MNGKYISCQEIIGNIIRDTGFTTEVQWADWVQWCAEAVDFIGAPRAYMPKTDVIEINNYRGELPCDLHEITQISGLSMDSMQFPMKYSTDSFHPVYSNKTIPMPQPADIGYIPPIGTDANGNPTFNYNSNGAFSINNEIYAGVGDLVSCNEATYTLNDDYIFTSFPDTFKVFIAYKAFPVDADGYPMIPDNIRFKQAVQAYVRFKVDYILWRRNDIPRDVFQHSEQDWLFYCASAGNVMRVPSIDMMESMKDAALRLIPKINRHKEGFRYLNSGEQRLK